jgi:RNA polymerase sigma-70 factor (ECF subfamily)
MIDAASFDAIVIEHQDRVHRVVLSVMGPGFEADAEDVTQDVFVHLLRALDSFRGESALGTWLHRVAFNFAVTRKRRARFRTPHVGTEALSTFDAPATETHARRDVLRAVDRLPDAYRAVIHLHYWMGESVEEMAMTLSRPPGTVKSHLHRARALLRAILEETP